MTTFRFGSLVLQSFLRLLASRRSRAESFTSEVTFVDDEAFLMTATTRRGLKRVITDTLETVTSVIHQLQKRARPSLL